MKNITWLLMVCGIVGQSAAAYPQGPPKRYTIWDIHLGQTASAIPDEYVNLACGTNGGPPSLPLRKFNDFMKCKPDGMGLREVYFEYDDELEYQARALHNRPDIRRYAGTTVFEFPIVASALFDNGGVVRGERMVTDPRQQVSRDRLEFWELANFLRQNFGDAGWDCKDLPLEEGETLIGSRSMKTRCQKIASGIRMLLDQRFLQKRGQQFVDQQSSKAQQQAFESATRFEMFDAALSPQ